MQSAVDLAWKTMEITWLLATGTIGLMLWGLIIWGICATFKNFRLYSRHWLAVKLRRMVDRRRASRRERSNCAAAIATSA